MPITDYISSTHGRLGKTNTTVSPLNNLLYSDSTLAYAHRDCAGSLNINTYHGHDRETDVTSLSDWDIFITTYHTIAADALDPENPLGKIV